MITEAFYIILIAVICIIAAVIFAKRGQTEHLKRLICELYEQIDSDELIDKLDGKNKSADNSSDRKLKE